MPSVWRGETIVVSIASWAPPCSGNPSATTSNRLPSNLLGSVRSMSRKNTFKRTRAPPSLQTLAAADSNAQPLRPSTPAVAEAARWWPRASNGRPHRQLRTEKGKGQSKSSKEQHTERRGVNPQQPTRRKGDETRCLPTDHTVTSSWPSRGLATLAKRHSSSGVAQLTKRPAVANPCVADTDPLLLLLPHMGFAPLPDVPKEGNRNRSKT